MKVLLIDNGTSLLERLKQLIPGAEVVRRWDQLGNVSAADYELIVLSGSRDHAVVWEEELFEAECNLIRSAETPIVGICFGCELITRSFGGELRRLSDRCHGIKEIRVIDRGLFDGPHLNVYESHHWVISQCPADFQILAESTDGPEIIKHKSRPIYGLQFHPENLVDQTEGDELFLNLLVALDKKQPTHKLAEG
jgi:GMP synthase (glutamine-hydrolysing)